MVESYLEISCDGCGDLDSSDASNITQKEFRKSLRRYGWRSYGTLDYCRKCVDSGVAAEKQSIFVVTEQEIRNEKRI